jgi:hypothetical protein
VYADIVERVQHLADSVAPRRLADKVKAHGVRL